MHGRRFHKAGSRAAADTEPPGGLPEGGAGALAAATASATSQVAAAAPPSESLSFAPASMSLICAIRSCTIAGGTHDSLRNGECSMYNHNEMRISVLERATG